MVSCGEVSRVRKIYHRGVKKLCSNVGFEQRCTVRRKVHIAEMSVRGCILTAISILGGQHWLGTQLWWELEMRWQLRWWLDRIPLFFALPFFPCFLSSHQHSETMSSVDMQKHTVQWCYGVTVKSQACLLVRADSRETLTDPLSPPWWLYFFFFQNTSNLTALVVFFPLTIHASHFQSLYVCFL